MQSWQRWLTVLFLLADVASAGPAQQPVPTSAPACPCSVEIVVHRLASGEPIPGTEIVLFRWASQDSTGADFQANARTQFANNDGTAMFRYLESGRYTVIAKHDGFTDRSGELESSYTFNIPEPPGSRSPGEGSSVDRRIPLSLVGGGNITGTLRNEKGEPAAGISVGAFRVIYSHGQRELIGVKAAETDHDLGEYSLGLLPDGEYYLRTDQPYSPVYFPGTLDPALALPVILRDGRQMTNGDFQLPEKGGVTISGTVTVFVPGGDRLPDGGLLRSISTLYLVRHGGFRDEYPQALSNTVEGSQNRNGGSEFKFEVHNVAPGAYDLYPVFVDTATSTRPLYFTEKNFIEVGANDSVNMHVSIHPLGEITARVTAIDVSPVPSTRNRPPIGPISIQLDSVDPLPQPFGGNRPVSTPLASNGTARITNLIPGKYAFTLQPPLTGDFYVSEMRQGARDFSDDGMFDIQSGVSEPIDIVLCSGGAAIHGSVQKPKGNFGSLVLIPDPPRRRNRLYYRSVRLQPTGNFDLTGIAPGTYKLFAWDALPDGAESNAEFLEQFEARGVRVTVAAGSVLSDIRVPLILNTN